jgi:hypothetical protein
MSPASGRVASLRLAPETAAVDFLGRLPFVDRERIGAIGVCGSGSFGLAAAEIDSRIKAIAKGMNAGIEAGADEVQAAFLGRRELELHVGRLPRELRQLRCENHPGRDARRDESHSSCGPSTKACHMVQCAADIGQGRAQSGDELLSSFSRGDAAGCARQQPDAKSFLQAANRDAQPLRGLSETSLLCHDKKCRQHAEHVANHS